MNSTLSGNAASGGAPNGDSTGAGIFNRSGAISLTSVTIANGTAAHGAGIFAYQGMFTVMNSILANSTTDDCAQDTGTVVSAGWNLVRAPGNCANFSVTTKDILNIDPKLGALANNGGPTFTRAIPTTSLAFERGRCSQATDQRGVHRVNLPICDIGAYEVTRFVLHILFQGTGHGSVTSSTGSVNCSLDCDVVELQGSGEDLTASPDPGSTFLGWDDACSGTGDCSVFFNQNDVTVIVRFGAVGPTPDARLGGSIDAPSGGAIDAPSGGAIDAPSGGAIDAPSGGSIDAPVGGQFDAPVGGNSDAPVGIDASVRDAAVGDGSVVVADAMPSDASTGGNQDGPGILPLDRGCGCHIGSDPAEAPSMLLLLGLTALLARRRRAVGWARRNRSVRKAAHTDSPSSPPS